MNNFFSLIHIIFYKKFFLLFLVVVVHIYFPPKITFFYLELSFGIFQVFLLHKKGRYNGIFFFSTNTLVACGKCNKKFYIQCIVPFIEKWKIFFFSPILPFRMLYERAKYFLDSKKIFLFLTMRVQRRCAHVHEENPTNYSTISTVNIRERQNT